MSNIKTNINLEELKVFLTRLKADKRATPLDRRELEKYYHQATGIKRDISGCGECIMQVISSLDNYILAHLRLQEREGKALQQNQTVAKPKKVRQNVRQNTNR